MKYGFDEFHLVTKTDTEFKKKTAHFFHEKNVFICLYP